MDAIKMQLPVANKVSSALNGWTSANKVTIKLVIVYFMVRNWALRKVQRIFYEINFLFFSCFES